MDRDRYRRRVRELGESTKLIESLAKVPDRATEKDFRLIIDQLRAAATDIEALLEADLPGCACRRVDRDDSYYLDYVESCRHHGHLFSRLASNKKHYEDAAQKLKDEVRGRLVASALSGAAGTVLVTMDAEVDDVVAIALRIADHAIQAILKGDA